MKDILFVSIPDIVALPLTIIRSAKYQLALTYLPLCTTL
jgi:hypothetical protein